MGKDYFLKRWIINIYRWLNKHNWEKAVVIILIACMIFDFVPYEYWPGFKDIFVIDGDSYTGIAGMILVVWTFTMSLVVFWLGHMESRCYGIQNIELYKRSLSKDKSSEKTSGEEFVKKIIKMGSAVLMELVAVFFAAFFEWEITLKVTAFFQIVTMVYALVAVCVEGSREDALKQIKESSVEYIMEEFEKGKGLNDFLEKMVENTEFENESEVTELNEAVTEIVSEIGKRLEEDNEFNTKKWNLQWYLKTYMDCVFCACKNRNISEQIVKNLFSILDNVYAKTGIFFSVIDYEYQEEMPDTLEVLNTAFKDRNLVVAAGLAYSQYISISKNHYEYLVAKLKCHIEFPLTETVLDIIRDTWIELLKEIEREDESKLKELHMNKLMELLSGKGVTEQEWKGI